MFQEIADDLPTLHIFGTYSYKFDSFDDKISIYFSTEYIHKK